MLVCNILTITHLIKTKTYHVTSGSVGKMSYGKPITHQSLNGQLSSQANGSPALNTGASLDTQLNGGPNGPLAGLKAVDPDQLKSRLYSYAPQQASVNPKVLRFNRVTQTQVRKANIPTAPKLEPVVSKAGLLCLI